MSEQDFGTTPPAAEPAATEASWGSTQPPYTAPGYTATPPSQLPQPAVAQGLSESTASALAYITIIPAIIFLLVAPYNQSPKIKFHAIQEIGLSIVGFVLGFFLIIPILGWIIWLVGGLSLLVVWIMCIVKASQGSALKIPGISNFAAQQSGYVI